MIHELKTYPEYFEAAKSGRKPFEVRKNDRPYAVGDYLALNKYIPHDAGEGKRPGYTGECILEEVTFILSDEKYCKPGFVILGTALREIVKSGRPF